MATKIQTLTTYFDDMTGKEVKDGEVQHREFTHNGKTVRLDLSKASAKTFDDTVQAWMEKGTQVFNAGTRRAKRSTGGTSARRKDLPEIREWAKTNGHKVSDRGRVAASVIEAYDAR